MSDATPNSGYFYQLGLGFMASRTFLAAIEMGLYSELAKGPATREALERRFELHPRASRDFLDALVALGTLTRDADHRYANSREADLFLDRAKPGYVGGMLEMAGRRLYKFWDRLPDALHTGEPQNETRGGGEDIFASLYGNPQGLAVFLGGMTGASLPVAQAIAATFPWANYKTVIDIGAAQGAVPATLARSFPHLSGGGFDLPPVGPVFEAFMQKNGVADRMRFYPGSFFTDPLPTADVLIMGHILHDWDMAQKRFLIDAAYQALPEGGVYIVYDCMIDDERKANVAGLMMSLNMVIETPGGFDYTGADCRGWLTDAGFKHVRTQQLTPSHSMCVGVK